MSDFPFSVEQGSCAILYINGTYINEQTHWLEETLGSAADGKWKIAHSVKKIGPAATLHRTFVKFRTEADAVHYKLRWK